MNERYIRHLPVVDNEKLIGIVTIRDIVHKIISTQKFTIRELEKYIYGTM
jgi:CBS domain-containing protein